MPLKETTQFRDLKSFFFVFSENEDLKDATVPAQRNYPLSYKKISRTKQ